MAKTGVPRRAELIEQRVLRLINDFHGYVSWYDDHCPFARPEQLRSHLRTIQHRLELRTAAAAIADEKFRQSLYGTLQAWGIGQRGSRLLARPEFDRGLVSMSNAVAALDGVAIDDPSVGAAVIAELWSIMRAINIVDNKAPLVPNSKALHHLLPELVVPIDREYTRRFFGWYSPEFQGHGEPDGQRKVFTRIFLQLARIAKATNLASLRCNEGTWRTSRTKILDNAIIGYCRKEHLPPLS